MSARPGAAVKVSITLSGPLRPLRFIQLFVLCADLMDFISHVSYLTIIINSPLKKAFINGQRIYEMP
jgi:hypothetical protein